MKNEEFKMKNEEFGDRNDSQFTLSNTWAGTVVHLQSQVLPPVVGEQQCQASKNGPISTNTNIMKNLIFTFTVLALTFSSLVASTTPEVIVSSAAVEVVSVETLDFFTDAGFDADTDNLIFTTTKEMSVVQIFNAEGTMEFQLPVMANNVQINKNLFGQGEYKLGFVLEGQSQVHFTQVTVK